MTHYYPNQLLTPDEYTNHNPILPDGFHTGLDRPIKVWSKKTADKRNIHKTHQGGTATCCVCMEDKPNRITWFCRVCDEGRVCGGCMVDLKRHADYIYTPYWSLREDDRQVRLPPCPNCRCVKAWSPQGASYSKMKKVNNIALPANPLMDKQLKAYIKEYCDIYNKWWAFIQKAKDHNKNRHIKIKQEIETDKTISLMGDKINELDLRKQLLLEQLAQVESEKTKVLEDKVEIIREIDEKYKKFDLEAFEHAYVPVKLLEYGGDKDYYWSGEGGLEYIIENNGVSYKPYMVDRYEGNKHGTHTTALRHCFERLKQTHHNIAKRYCRLSKGQIAPTFDLPVKVGDLSVAEREALIAELQASLE